MVCALPSKPPILPAMSASRTLPIVPERRVTKVVGQTGAVDHVRITAEQCADLATDLGDFQRMRQSSASEIVGTGNQNLAFRAQTRKADE